MARMRGLSCGNNGWVLLGMFWALVGLTEAMLIALYRSGLQIPWSLLASSAGVLASSAFMPALVTVLMPRVTERVPYLAPLSSLIVLASPLAAFALGSGVGLIAAACGAAALLAFSVINMRYLATPKCWWLPVLAGITAWYLFTRINNLDFATIYTPEQAYLGKLNTDTQFHIAIAQMIQHFGVASLGMDGLVPIRYHVGSHWWLAALGTASHTEPLISYPVGVIVVAVPALLMGASFAAYAMARDALPAAGALLGVLILVWVTDTILGSWPFHYVSESYTFGLAAMFLLLPALDDAIER